MVDYVIYIGIDALLFKGAISKTSDLVALRNLWLQESGTTFCAALVLHIVSHPPRLLYFLSLVTALYGLSRAFISLSEACLFLRRVRHSTALFWDHAVLWFHRWRRRRMLQKFQQQAVGSGTENYVDDYRRPQSRVQRNAHPMSSAALLAQQRFKSPRIAGPLLFASPLVHECTTMTPIRSQKYAALMEETPLPLPSKHKRPAAVGNGDGCNWLLRPSAQKAASSSKRENAHESGGLIPPGTLGKWRNVIWGADAGGKLSNIGRLGMRLIGSGITSSVQLPSGLRNGGSNICFLNSVIQLLRQSPGVAQLCCEPHLAGAWRVNAQRSVSHEQLLHSLRALLDAEAASNRPLLDTVALRRAAAPLCRLLKAPDAVGDAQPQQDAALCLEWLLDASQDAIGAPCDGGVAAAARPRFWSRALAAVAQDYGSNAAGVVSPVRMTRLSGAARNQLLYGAVASSLPELLRSDGAGRLLRRVADLDWWLDLAARAAGDAPCLARLFEGQIMDVRMCLSCRQAHVDTRAFRQLVVSLPAGAAAVPLAECLALSVGQLERLAGLVCERCSAGHAPNAAAALSPIVGAAVTPRQLGGAATSTPVYGAPTQAATPAPATPHQQMRLLARAPTLLAVRLARFGTGGRINTRVLLPPELALRELCLDAEALCNADAADAADAQALYQLYGCVLHRPAAAGGDPRGLEGHYVTLCRLHAAPSEQWLRCDDEAVRTVAPEAAWRELRSDAGAAQVYLAFYARAE